MSDATEVVTEDAKAAAEATLKAQKVASLAKAREAQKAKRDAAKAAVPDEAALVAQAKAAAAAFQAHQAGVAAPPPAKAVPGKVVFRSARPEPTRLHIDMGNVEMRSSFDGEYIEFQVPEALADRFRRHVFVKTGRIVEVG